MLSFAHIINGVSEKENKDLYEVQKLTLASFINASDYSEGSINVKQYICYHKNHHINIDSSFHALPQLEKSILDIGNFSNNRALPLLKDILELVYNNSDAEYIIYSNADIGLMPQFYNAIADYIKSGHDAIVVNRRRVKSTLNKAEDLDLIYSEVGKDHIGYDMFIFKKSLFPKFVLNNTCIGIPFVGNDLFYNLFCFAEKPVLLTDKHLTFHIGLELLKDWGSNELKKHNYKEFRKTTKALLPYIDITKFPGAELNIFKRHFKWLMNPTLSYSELCISDLKQLGKKRNRKIYDQNYKKQSYYEWLIKYINFD
ncbi:MAG: hypothetical protein IPJ32_08800 [Sphingobacteriaceae bacterium]|nr:hypothetical protein [Sphingobacteriaceae bacterium]